MKRSPCRLSYIPLLLLTAMVPLNIKDGDGMMVRPVVFVY